MSKFTHEVQEPVLLLTGPTTRVFDFEEYRIGCRAEVDSIRKATREAFVWSQIDKDVLPELFAPDLIALPCGTGICSEDHTGASLRDFLSNLVLNSMFAFRHRIILS